MRAPEQEGAVAPRARVDDARSPGRRSGEERQDRQNGNVAIEDGVCHAVNARLGKTKPEVDPVPPRKAVPPNGANGAHGAGGGKTAVTTPPKPNDPSKARKVGYV